MGLTAVIFGEQRRDVVGYKMSVGDLARATLPDSKLAEVKGEFSRNTFVGPVEYTLTYWRKTIAPLPSGHAGPYISLYSHHFEPPLMAHSFKPHYVEDFAEVERTIAELTQGRLRERTGYDTDYGEKASIDLFQDILLSRQLTKEEIGKLLKDPRLKAVNPTIWFVKFEQTTKSEFSTQTRLESKFHW